MVGVKVKTKLRSAQPCQNFSRILSHTEMHIDQQCRDFLWFEVRPMAVFKRLIKALLYLHLKKTKQTKNIFNINMIYIYTWIIYILHVYKCMHQGHPGWWGKWKMFSLCCRQYISCVFFLLHIHLIILNKNKAKFLKM